MFNLTQLKKEISRIAAEDETTVQEVLSTVIAEFMFEGALMRKDKEELDALVTKKFNDICAKD